MCDVHCSTRQAGAMAYTNADHTSRPPRVAIRLTRRSIFSHYSRSIHPRERGQRAGGRAGRDAAPPSHGRGGLAGLGQREAPAIDAGADTGLRSAACQH
jgi:hypothetical protein